MTTKAKKTDTETKTDSKKAEATLEDLLDLTTTLNAKQSKKRASDGLQAKEGRHTWHRRISLGRKRSVW